MERKEGVPSKEEVYNTLKARSTELKSNAELKELAKNNPPPPEYYEEDWEAPNSLIDMEGILNDIAKKIEDEYQKYHPILISLKTIIDDLVKQCELKTKDPNKLGTYYKENISKPKS